MTTEEKPLSYGAIVTEDHILSGNGKWYEVLEAVNLPDGNTRFRLVGVGNAFLRPSAQVVQVRRSEMGKAVDIFVQVMSSGPA